MNPKFTLVTVCTVLLVVIGEVKTEEFDVRAFLDRIIEATFDSTNDAEIGAIGGRDTRACSDYADWCTKYKSHCSNVKAVQQYCKLTCNKCPKTTTTAKPTTTSKPSTENCRDIHPKCQRAFKLGYCTGEQMFVNFMKRNCPKTCNFCTKCKAVDANANCHGIKKYCSNKLYEKYMTKNCAKTCGFCKPEFKCGVAKRRSNGKSKPIVGGVEAAKGYYPWQVAIYYDDDFQCGGSLIGDKHVLTAAHCFIHLSTDPDRYKVVLGDHDRSTEEGTEKKMAVKSIAQHKEYIYTSDTHDIAIMELSSPVVFTDDINPICLPSTGERLPTGSICYLTGWGSTRHAPRRSDRLMEVAMPIADLDHCKERNTFNAHVVNDRMICAGYKNGFKFQSGCHGDSGGPLACEQPDKTWVLHGVVSWGSPTCDGLSRYTVFTKVSKYIHWINKKQKKAA